MTAPRSEWREPRFRELDHAIAIERFRAPELRGFELRAERDVRRSADWRERRAAYLAETRRLEDLRKEGLA